MVFDCLTTLQDHVIKTVNDFMVKNASSYVTTFGGHRHCDSRDIIALVCHVISPDHVIKGSCDFMGRSSSR